MKLSRRLFCWLTGAIPFIPRFAYNNNLEKLKAISRHIRDAPVRELFYYCSGIVSQTPDTVNIAFWTERGRHWFKVVTHWKTW